MDTTEDNLETRLRLLYSLYERLRDGGLAALSQTARLLEEADMGKLRTRLADELEELAGVAAGTHHHHGLPDDLVLEGSQVLYWTLLNAVAARLPYEELAAHEQLSESSALWPTQAAVLGQLLALGLRGAGGAVPPADLRATLRQVGLTCAALGVPPIDLIEHDLAQMRAKPYLQDNLKSKI